MMKKKLAQVALLILIIITIGIAGCVSAPGGNQTVCTMDAKQCPDGSYVGRDPAKNCEFRPCPGEETTCVNKCGDGVCDEVVCQGTGCPCAETKETCPQDCYVGLANPASVFCVEGGGTHKVIDTPEGQAGYCEFADGNVCEEWEFFRSNSTICNPPA